MVVSGKLWGLKVVQLSQSPGAMAVQSSFAIKENFLFMVLKRATPISLPSLAKTIMKNTQYETQELLVNHILDWFFKGAESKQLPGTLVEQFGFAASWEPLAYRAVSFATKEHPLYALTWFSERNLQSRSMLNNNSELHNTTFPSTPHLITITSSVSWRIAHYIYVGTIGNTNTNWISSVFSKTNKHHSFPTD